MKELLIILLSGGIGTLARYQLSGFAQKFMGNGFAWGTLAVNLTGSFLIGVITQVGVNSDIMPPVLRIALTVGFLGAFTTFSAFSYETLGYVEKGAWSTAGLNVLINVVPGIIAVFLGVLLARGLTGKV